LTTSFGGQASVGLVWGAGGQGSVTVGLMKSGTKLYLAGYGEYGAAARGPNGYWTSAKSPMGLPPIFVGGYVGAGFSSGLTNAKTDGILGPTSQDGLMGQVDKYNLNIALGGFSTGTSLSFANTTGAGGASLKYGVGLGVDVTEYPTQTDQIFKILLKDFCK
jgi:hypothetical protein